MTAARDAWPAVTAALDIFYPERRHHEPKARDLLFALYINSIATFDAMCASADSTTDVDWLRTMTY